MAVRAGDRAPVLPWGWWLRAGADGFEDGDGRSWSTVRDAFWQGRLGFFAAYLAPEQHELLLRVLSAADTGWFNQREGRLDLFDGHMMFWRFYMCWLGSVGLLDLGLDAGGRDHLAAPALRASALEAPLSEEGRSVLLMLQATREPGWEMLPMAAVIEAVRVADRTAADHGRERALRDFERGVTHLTNLFARETVGTSHSSL